MVFQKQSKQNRYQNFRKSRFWFRWSQTVIWWFSHKILDLDDFGAWKSPKLYILLTASTNSFSEPRKDFLDRKKVLKSLEANSLIYRGNVVLPARDDVHRAPNARLANEQKQNHQILHDFCHFSSTLARNWARRGTQKSQMTEILQRKLSLGPY